MPRHTRTWMRAKPMRSLPLTSTARLWGISLISRQNLGQRSYTTQLITCLTGRNKRGMRRMMRLIRLMRMAGQSWRVSEPFCHCEAAGRSNPANLETSKADMTGLLRSGVPSLAMTGGTSSARHGCTGTRARILWKQCCRWQIKAGQSKSLMTRSGPRRMPWIWPRPLRTSYCQKQSPASTTAPTAGR